MNNSRRLTVSSSLDVLFFDKGLQDWLNKKDIKLIPGSKTDFKFLDVDDQAQILELFKEEGRLKRSTLTYEAKCSIIEIKFCNGSDGQFFSADLQFKEKNTEDKESKIGVSNNVFDSFFYSSNSLLSVIGFDGRFKILNDIWANTLGYDKKDLESKAFIDFVHPDDVESTKSLTIKMVSGEHDSVISFTNRYRAKSGDYRWIEWHAVADVSDSLFYCVSIDVTDTHHLHEETEKSLKRANELLKAVNNAAKIGTWEVDIENMTSKWSEMTKLIHEVPLDYVSDVEKGINFYKEGISRDTISKQFFAAIENGINFDEELEIITAKGNEKWVRAIGIPVFRKEKCVAVHGTFQDITERKQIELENENLSIVASKSNTSVVITDHNQGVIWVNNKFKELTGYSFEEVENKRLGSFLQGPDTNPEDIKNIKLGIKSRKPFSQLIKNYSKDGTPYWNELNITPVFDDSGTLIQFIGIQNNVTELKETTIELNESRDSLIQVLDQKNTLFKELHHRIKNNLQFFNSVLYLKAIGSTNEELISFVDDTNGRIMAISQVHNLLLQLEEVDRLDVKSYLETLSKQLIDSFAKKANKFIVEMEVCSEIMSVDYIMVLGLVTNEALSNTIKYAYPEGEGGKIKILLTKEGEFFTYLIQDFGIGINEELKRKGSIGLKLIQTLSRQVRATYEIFGEGGVKHQLKFKLR